MKEFYVIEVINYDRNGELTEVKTSSEGYAKLEHAQEFLKSRCRDGMVYPGAMFGYGQDERGRSIRYNILPITVNDSK